MYELFNLYMSIHNIQEIIINSNIESICNPQTGDCVSVAVAIKNLFGGEYVCAYQNPIDKIPAHATVRIDGILYDSNGSTTMDALYDVAISGLKPDNIGSKDDHIHSVSELKNNAYYDKEKDKKVREILRNNIDQ